MTTMVLQLHFGKCITDTTLEMDGMVPMNCEKINEAFMNATGSVDAEAHRPVDHLLTIRTRL